MSKKRNYSHKRNHRVPQSSPKMDPSLKSTRTIQFMEANNRYLKRRRHHFNADGYTNAAIGLGEASLLFNSNTYVADNISKDTELLTNAYRESWIAKRIIDMPAEDMTRAWYKLATPMEEEELQALAQLEAQHNVKQEITNAIRWARLYGGSIAVMIICPDLQKPEEPLDLNVMMPDAFRGLLVFPRGANAQPSLELEADLRDPEYGLPKYYEIQMITEDEAGREQIRMVRYHHSRVLRFTGRELPPQYEPEESYWGISEMEHIWDELMRRNSIISSIAELVYRARVTTLKSSDILDQMAAGTSETREGIMKAIAAENDIRTAFGIQILNEGDSLETESFNFSGLPEIYKCCMADVAGAAGIPATKLFGKSPDGENATGESDLQNYYESIAALQERMLRPALEKLLPILMHSCWFMIPEKYKIIFNPVRTLSLQEKLEAAETHTRIVLDALKAGLITQEEGRSEIQSISEQTGILSKLQ